MGTRCANHVTPLYPQKLALTSPTGGGRSVGMVRSRTKATEFSSSSISISSGGGGKNSNGSSSNGVGVGSSSSSSSGGGVGSSSSSSSGGGSSLGGGGGGSSNSWISGDNGDELTILLGGRSYIRFSLSLVSLGNL